MGLPRAQDQNRPFRPGQQAIVMRHYVRRLVRRVGSKDHPKWIISRAAAGRTRIDEYEIEHLKE